MENQFFIYKIENKINNKIYIGKTSRPLEKRWNEHTNASYRYKDNIGLSINLLYRSIRKYGIINFEIKIVCQCIDINELNELETFLIDEYRLSYPNKIYNIAKGGAGGSTWNNHPKRNEFAQLKKEQMLGENNPMYGKSVYDIWLQKYGKEEADKRQKESNKNKKGNWELKFGKEKSDKLKHEQSLKFKNREFTENWKEKISISKTSTGNAMYGKNQYKIWVEKYGEEEANHKMQLKSDRIKKAKEKTDYSFLNKKVINKTTGMVFNSLKEAEVFYKISYKIISEFCRGIRKNGQYEWEFFK